MQEGTEGQTGPHRREGRQRRRRAPIWGPGENGEGNTAGPGSRLQDGARTPGGYRGTTSGKTAPGERRGRRGSGWPVPEARCITSQCLAATFSSRRRACDGGIFFGGQSSAPRASARSRRRRARNRRVRRRSAGKPGQPLQWRRTSCARRVEVRRRVVQRRHAQPARRRPARNSRRFSIAISSSVSRTASAREAGRRSRRHCARRCAPTAGSRWCGAWAWRARSATGKPRPSDRRRARAARRSGACFLQALAVVRDRRARGCASGRPWKENSTRSAGPPWRRRADRGSRRRRPPRPARRYCITQRSSGNRRQRASSATASRGRGRGRPSTVDASGSTSSRVQ